MARSPPTRAATAEAGGTTTSTLSVTNHGPPAANVIYSTTTDPDLAAGQSCVNTVTGQPFVPVTG